MNKIVRKIQQATEKAEEIRRVVEGVPPKIAEVRAAFAHTAGHVQKLRGDVMNTVGTLRVENDAQILDTLREIAAHVETLQEAGCRLERVDMDLGPTRRLVVHLERNVDVELDDLQILLEEHKDLPTIRALLGAIIKADELAHKVELSELDYTRLTVELGLISTVRMGWRMASATASPMTTPPPAHPIAPNRATGPEHVVPTFAQSTYFEPRAAAAATMAGGELKPEAATLGVGASSVGRSVTANSPKPSPLAGDWRKTALDRFKKMPDLSK
jgi:hypothetical protein